MLESCNIELSSVASDITGVATKAMLRVIINDADDLVVNAELAKSKMKNKQKDFEKALLGLVGPH